MTARSRPLDWRFTFTPRELTKRKITIGEDFENDEILTPAKFEFQNAAIDDTVTVAYEVEGNGNGGDIVINCPNPTGSGYFIHFLSPNLPPLEKEIIFLIDKSGSMRKARRMQQAKEAMHNILGQDSNYQREFVLNKPVVHFGLYFGSKLIIHDLFWKTGV